jgi:DNA polymerase III epsilon subunit-like protein
MNYVFVDFEMNQVSPEHKAEKKICKNEIIEIGAVKLDDKYNEIDSFKTYVKPVLGSMAPRITKLTGITDEMLADAPHYEEVIGDFIEWCDDSEVVYAWSENDLRQIRDESRLKSYTHPKMDSIVNRWKDFQKEYANLIGTSKRISLSDAVFFLGENFQGAEHDALWDARNTAEVFKLSKDEDKFFKIMAPVIEVYKPKAALTYSLSDVFGNVHLDS